MFAHMHTYLLLTRGLYHICTYVCTCVHSSMYSISMHTCTYICIAMWSMLVHNVRTYVRTMHRKCNSIAFSFPVFHFTLDSEERKSASRDKCVATFFIVGLFVCMSPANCSSGCGVLYKCTDCMRTFQCMVCMCVDVRGWVYTRL